MKRLSTAFPWFGGKAMPRIKNFILKHLPPHDKYVEPFGGGASILIAKEPAGVEVYNDVNRGLVNFFRVIADVEYFGRFIARVSLLPVSRALFEEYARTWSGIHEPIEQAVRWYVMARQCFAGHLESWGISVNTSSKGMAQVNSSWLSSIQSLPGIHKRMQRVQIECTDWRDCLKHYAGPGWLAYCDPPYVLGARKSGGYEHELKDGDHEDLIKALMKYDGAVLLSGYNSEIYRPLIEAGWDKQEIPVVCSAAGRTRASGLQGIGNASAKQRRTECLWRNHEAVRRIKNA